jgi:hypothetical protein
MRFFMREDVSFLFEGRKLAFNPPIVNYKNRYFLPVRQFVLQAGGFVQLIGTKICIFINDSKIIIDLYEGKYRGIFINNDIYLSFSDIVNCLKLKACWNYEREEIAISFVKKTLQHESINPSNKPALIRFEDVAAGPPYDKALNLEKLRMMCDYLFSRSVPFHVAWIPRYIDPANDIDNDISKNFSIANTDFLYTIDYMVNKGALIGLHGYTHQYGDEVSGYGTEFNESRNNNERSIVKRIEAAENIAKRAEIHYSFFESPHYASNEFQQSIFEEYFDYIYEPCVGIWGDKPVASPRNKRTIYVPTPLSYVSGKNGTYRMLKRIINLKADSLASLFYHPIYEMDFIDSSSLEYPEDSPLHLMIETLEENGYFPVSIKDIEVK